MSYPSASPRSQTARDAAPRIPDDWAPDPAGADPFVVQDRDGRRFVVVPEDHFRRLTADPGADGVPAPRVRLTDREREVLQLTADGRQGAAVAQQLGLAVNTVAQHLASVRRKYGVTSSAAAAALARSAGLIT